MHTRLSGDSELTACELTVGGRHSSDEKYRITNKKYMHEKTVLFLSCWLYKIIPPWTF